MRVAPGQISIMCLLRAIFAEATKFLTREYRQGWEPVAV